MLAKTDDLASLSWRRLHLSESKLKATSEISAVLSGFAMVAMVEVNINTDTKVPAPLLIVFCLSTTLLISVHMLALMIATCILPNIKAVSSSRVVSSVNESPHERMQSFIQLAWIFSTVFGLMLFLVEIALLCWIKFYDINYGKEAALAATILLVPIVLVFITFAIHFYRSLADHKYELSINNLNELRFEVSKFQSEESLSKSLNTTYSIESERKSSFIVHI